MRKIAVLVILAVFLAIFCFSVVRMENLRAEGRDALLPLAPVDPRALLMGDYMALDYALNNEIRKALSRNTGDDADAALDGKVVIRLATSGDGPVKPGEGLPFPVAVFVRLDDGAPPAPDEMPLAFRARGRRVVTASPSFYFQEGDARLYERARYGRIKIGGSGGTLLVALCDEAGQDLNPDP